MPAPSPSPTATPLPDQPLESPAAPPAFYQAGAYGLDDSWAYLMRQLLSASLRQVADALVDQDLPSVQWMPLLRLAAGQRCTVVALARDLGVDAATMTRAVDKLVAKGWVERQRCGVDRRQVELHITNLGQERAVQLQPLLTQVLNAPLAGFSHADWQQLLGLLRRMKAASGQTAAPSCEAAPSVPSASGTKRHRATPVSGSTQPTQNKSRRKLPGTG